MALTPGFIGSWDALSPLEAYSSPRPTSPYLYDCTSPAAAPLVPGQQYPDKITVVMSVSEIESHRERSSARDTAFGSFPASCRPDMSAAHHSAGNRRGTPLQAEIARLSKLSSSALGGLFCILQGVMASLIRILTCGRRPRASLPRMLGMFDVCHCLCLMLAVCSPTLAYSNIPLQRAVHHDFALRSQSSNICWTTSCGSSYNVTQMPQTICDPGAYVYEFTVTSGTIQFPSSYVNRLVLTCSNGKTLSQGNKPKTVNNIRQIINATGFSSVELAPGCVLNHMRIGGVDVGNVGYGNLSSCGCPAGSLITGLTQNHYDPNVYPSFFSFGIVCDNGFCSKGQYYSAAKCVSCPSGLKLIAPLI